MKTCSVLQSDAFSSWRLILFTYVLQENLLQLQTWRQMVNVCCKSLCLCWGGMCSELRLSTASAAVPQGTALSGSLASSKVGLDAFSHSFLCPCDCACFIEEE